jgi:hypothetical protein
MRDAMNRHALKLTWTALVVVVSFGVELADHLAKALS